MSRHLYCWPTMFKLHLKAVWTTAALFFLLLKVWWNSTIFRLWMWLFAGDFELEGSFSINNSWVCRFFRWCFLPSVCLPSTTLTHIYDKNCAALQLCFNSSPFVGLFFPFPDSLSKLIQLPFYSLLLALHPVCSLHACPSSSLPSVWQEGEKVSSNPKVLTSLTICTLADGISLTFCRVPDHV